MNATNQLDHIEDDPTVVKATRIADRVSIIWAERTAPNPNAVEVAADHGVDVTEIKRTGTATCYRVEVAC